MSWSDPLVILFAAMVVAMVVLGLLVLLPQYPGVQQLLVGVGADPRVVGLFRALLVYYLPIGVAAATAYLNHWTDPRLLGLVPFLLGLLRLAEGAVDNWLKPAQNAVNPPPVAGGGSPTLLEDHHA